MSPMDRYTKFIKEQTKTNTVLGLTPVKLDEGQNKRMATGKEESMHNRIRAGAKHLGMTLQEPIKHQTLGSMHFTYANDKLVPTHILDPFSGSADQAYYAGRYHGTQGHSPMKPPSDDHPHAAAYNKGYNQGAFMKGSQGRD